MSEGSSRFSLKNILLGLTIVSIFGVSNLFAGEAEITLKSQHKSDVTQKRSGKTPAETSSLNIRAKDIPARLGTGTAPPVLAPPDITTPKPKPKPKPPAK